jgi:hypothetical protein
MVGGVGRRGTRYGDIAVGGQDARAAGTAHPNAYWAMPSGRDRTGIVFGQVAPATSRTKPDLTRPAATGSGARVIQARRSTGDWYCPGDSLSGVIGFARRFGTPLDPAQHLAHHRKVADLDQRDGRDTAGTAEVFDRNYGGPGCRSGGSCRSRRVRLPRVAVPTSTALADLHQPPPHLLCRRMDRHRAVTTSAGSATNSSPTMAWWRSAVVAPQLCSRL